MKKTAFAAPVLAAALWAVAPFAHADGDNASAAALGFLLGTLATQQTYVYDAPPAVVYEPPPRVVVQVPDRVYEDDPSPAPVYYYGSRDHVRGYGHHGSHRWHRDGYRHWHDRGNDD